MYVCNNDLEGLQVNVYYMLVHICTIVIIIFDLKRHRHCSCTKDI